ncbi:hypothetical protein HPP92_017996 [Vanilla planifolia]|uniref:t-SNARE coiled-coil homology domain-containing protein n=1 Tax=Vanilla planifolia TaxID=51239 RepID=A0A835Q4Y8_VANPL|nr:hypothetical protein HPP92_017996 [Vanilla planifolia]
MNNLLTESFERIRGRYPGEPDMGSGSGSPAGFADANMDGFFKQVADIEKLIESITCHLHKLQAANEESKHVTKASTMKDIKEQMERDIEEVKKTAFGVKKSLEMLDRDNMANRKKPNCEKGTSVDRSRTAMTVALKKKLKERMAAFQILRQTIHEDYREAVERRVYTVTGTTPTEEMIENLIETGDGEQVFAKAIQGNGRGQIIDTLEEIQERRDTVIELEKKLIDLQQMFTDMAVLVDAQGDFLDDIEAQVSKTVDHVQKATAVLQETKKLQKNTRKYMCFGSLLLLIIITVVLAAILKKAKTSA